MGYKHLGSLAFLVGALLSSTAVYADPAVDALPTGGQIVSGSGNISTAGNTMTVQQNTAQMVANWSSFDIGAQAHVNFAQPDSSSIAINRIAGGASQIFGKLTSNGQVRLINPNGVIFGPSAQVDVGGLVASALEQSDTQMNTFTGTGLGAVVNKGAITVPPGGSVALIANNVSNEGTINAREGAVVLAAGEKVALDFAGDGLITTSVDKSALDAQVSNKGAIIADGGVVVMTARSTNALMNGVVNNDGIVQAKTLSNKGGRLILDGGSTGIVNVRGTMAANGENAGEKGGNITVTGHQIDIGADAKIQADGASGGGKINIGGGWQGGDASIRHAQRVDSSTGATITANATDNGNGGEVVLWSDDTTRVAGNIEARGGVNGGNGGRIETSGHALEIREGLNISTAAPKGTGGLWLIDPTYSTIGATEAGVIVGALNSGDVVNSSTGGTDISADIISASGHSLSFYSVGKIRVDNVTIETGGGNIYLGGSGGGSNFATGQTSGEAGVVINSSTLNAGAGTITINGKGYTPGDRSVLANSVSANENAGKGIVVSGTTNLTGSAITLNGTGGRGQNVQNETNVQSTVSCDGDFSCAARPAYNNSSVTGGDGAVGVDIQSGANLTMTAGTSVTINAEGGDGGDAGYLHASSGGIGANDGEGATAYVQAGNLTVDTPTATISATAGDDGDEYGEGYWAQYFDQEYDWVDDGFGNLTYQVVASGNKLQFHDDSSFDNGRASGMSISGNLTQTYSLGRTLNLISNSTASMSGVLRASYVKMRGTTSSDYGYFTFENAANTLDRIAADDLYRLTLNHNYDTYGQALHIGAVSDLNGITDVNYLYLRVTSTGDTGATNVLVQDSGASIYFGSLASLMADTMKFNGAANSINTFGSGNILLRTYDNARDTVIGTTDPDQGEDLYIPTADLTKFSTNIDYMMLGGDDNTGDIILNANAAFNHSLSLATDGAITIPHDITVPTNDALVLMNNGTINAPGVITAHSLYLLGDGGIFNFSNAANSVRTLSTDSNTNLSRLEFLNTGNLNIANSSGQVIDTSRAWNTASNTSVSTNGVRADDRVYINTTGNLVMNNGTVVYGLGAYTGALNYVNPANLNDQQKAAVLMVAGGNFENRSNNTSAISTSGANRFLVYSDTPNSWADQSTNFDFKMYAWDFYNSSHTDNGRNGYDYDNGLFGRSLPASATGDGFLYKHQPTLTITPTVQDGTYGNTPVLNTAYTFGYTASGYIDGDDQNDNTGTGVFTTTATSESNIGTYDISYTQAATGGLTGIVPKYNDIVLGYKVLNNTRVNGYTVNKRNITITANAGQSMVYGDSVPTLTYAVTGGSLVNTSSTGALAGALSTNATSASDIGTGYTISRNTLNNNNYNITYNGASFTVNKRPVTVTPNAGQSKIAGQTDPVYKYTASYTGNGAKPALVNGDTFTGTIDRNSGEDVGTYAYLLNTLAINDGTGGNNYVLTFADGTFRINPAVDLSNLTSVQTGITGTGQTSVTNVVTSSSMGPGTGSTTITDNANTQLVTDTTNSGSSLFMSDTGTGPSGTPPSFTGSSTMISMKSGNTVTVSRNTPSSMNNVDIPLPEGLPLIVSGNPDVRQYAIAGNGKALSSTYTGPASTPAPSGLTFITPSVSAPVATPGGGEINISVRISSTGVLVIEMPEGAIEEVDPQTAMLVALAVARENFGQGVTGIKSVYITPPVSG